MPGASLKSTSTPGPVSASRAPIAPLRLAVIGPPGAGKRSLLAALPSDSAMPFEITEALAPADGYVLLCEATLDAGELEENLDPLLKQLEATTKARGQSCEVAGLPVHLVLTKADVLAAPGESHAVWLDRVEEAKRLASNCAEKRLPGATKGFGAVAFHVWATAVPRPQAGDGKSLAPTPYGVAELAQHAVEAARRYAAHVELQNRRAQAVLSLVLLVLVAMSAAIVYWAIQHRGLFDGTTTAKYEADKRKVDQALAGQKLLDEATRLLSFANHRLANGGADWTRWRADADALRESILDAHDDSPLEEPSPWTIELLKALRRIDQVRIRAELLGLGEAPPPHRPALLRGPDGQTSYKDLCASTEAAYRHFSLFYRTFRPEPLPQELPLGVVHELEAAARASIERFCEPVRREIRERVLKLGGGKETLEAWQQLRDGWLAAEAEKELRPVRDLVLLVRVLDGRNAPRDPLRELVDFLHTPEFIVPLDELEVRFPVVFELTNEQRIGIRRAEGRLEVRHRRADREEIVQFEAERERLPEYWLFRQKPGEEKRSRLALQPGDEVSVRVWLEDIAHKTWLLTWSPADSGSRVYAFEVLTRAPRLHAGDQPDPARGIVAFGASLVFNGGEALRLPLLFPR